MRNKANGKAEELTECEHSEEKHSLDGDHGYNIRPYQDFL